MNKVPEEDTLFVGDLVRIKSGGVYQDAIGWVTEVKRDEGESLIGYIVAVIGSEGIVIDTTWFSYFEVEPLSPVLKPRNYIESFSSYIYDFYGKLNSYGYGFSDKEPMLESIEFKFPTLRRIQAPNTYDEDDNFFTPFSTSLDIQIPKMTGGLEKKDSKGSFAADMKYYLRNYIKSTDETEENKK